MTELKNVEHELDRFRGRLLAAALFVLVCFGLLAARLVYLQVFKHEELATQAENNRIAVVPIVPNRGLIVDRNGVVLATNYSAYTLEITPSKVTATLDATIDALAEVVEITPRDRRRFKRLLEDGKSFESLPIRTKLSDEEVARFTAQRFRFAGVDIKARLFRNYPLGEVGSHLLGYIGRINQAEKKAIDDSEESGQLPRHRVHRQARRRAELRDRAARHHRLRGGRNQRRRPRGAAPEATSRPRRATRCCCRSTSGCRRWSRRCSATGAARWWRWTRATAKCWPSSASRPSTRTCSSTASTSRRGAS